MLLISESGAYAGAVRRFRVLGGRTRRNPSRLQVNCQEGMDWDLKDERNVGLRPATLIACCIDPPERSYSPPLPLLHSYKLMQSLDQDPR